MIRGCKTLHEVCDSLVCFAIINPAALRILSMLLSYGGNQIEMGAYLEILKISVINLSGSSFHATS